MVWLIAENEFLLCCLRVVKYGGKAFKVKYWSNKLYPFLYTNDK